MVALSVGQFVTFPHRFETRECKIKVSVLFFYHCLFVLLLLVVVILLFVLFRFVLDVFLFGVLLFWVGLCLCFFCKNSIVSNGV